MGDAAWKAFERRLVAWFPACKKRRGADFRDVDGGGGNTDLICDGWAIEAKLHKTVTYGLLAEAADQADRNKECDDDIPVGVVKKLHAEDKNSWVVMRFRKFVQFFGNPFSCEKQLFDIGYLWVKMVTYQGMRKEIEALDNQPLNGNVPVVVAHKVGEELDDAIVIMKLYRFQHTFVNQ